MSQIDRACPDYIEGGKDKASCSGVVTHNLRSVLEFKPKRSGQF